MDTTPKYILMCEKAGEIQNTWRPFNGDIFIQKDYLDIPEALRQPVVLYFCTDSELIDFNKHDFYWLPRQDQLQEMLLDKFGIVNLLEYFHEWVKTKLICKIYSFEQLWLEYVMFDRYDKVWSETKKNWVHEKN